MQSDNTSTTTPDGDVQALVEEGLGASGILPQYERLVFLDVQLRAAINAMLPDAQDAADRLDRGSADWWSLQTAVDHARRTLAGDLGSGLRSAALHVVELARRCHSLSECLR